MNENLKNKTSKRKRKRCKNPFLNIESIIEKEMLLSELNAKQYLLSVENDKIIDEYDKILSFKSQKEAERFIDKLPIESLDELIRFEKGIRLNFVSDKIQKRSELKKISFENEEKNSKLTSEINLLKIDILLEKINYVINNML